MGQWAWQENQWCSCGFFTGQCRGSSAVQKEASEWTGRECAKYESNNEWCPLPGNCFENSRSSAQYRYDCVETEQVLETIH